MSYRIANSQPLGYVLESPKPIPTKVAPTATRMSVSKPTAAEASICLQKGGAWNKLTGTCSMPMSDTLPTSVDPAVAAAQRACAEAGGYYNNDSSSCGPQPEATLPPEYLCVVKGGAWDAVSGVCVDGGSRSTPQQLALACVQSGGAWDVATQQCSFLSAQQQPPASQGWWSSLSDGTKYAIIGGAAVGVLAIGAGIFMLARKPKSATPNAKRRARYAVEFYARGKWRLGRKFSTLSGAQAHEHNSVRYYGSASTRTIDLGTMGVVGSHRSP